MSNVVAIAAGTYHSLAITADRRVVAWGEYENDHMDDFTLIPVTAPSNLSNVVAIAGGNDHSLALTADGTVTAWGSYLGTYWDEFVGDWVEGRVPYFVPEGLTNVVAIAAGYDHSLALTAEHHVVAWGPTNAWGETTVPSGLANVVAIAAGDWGNLAIVCSRSGWRPARILAPRVGIGTVDRPFFSRIVTDEHDVRGYGAIGLPPGLAVNPTNGVVTGVPLLDGTYQVTLLATNLVGVGQGHWVLHVNRPLPRVTETGIVAAGVGSRFAYTISTVNEPDWFSASGLPLGLSVDAQTGVISGVPQVEGDFAIDVQVRNRHGVGGGSFTLRVSPVVGWGISLYGETTSPVGLSNVVAIAAGNGSSLALTADGRVFGWGYSPALPSGLSNVLGVAAGYDHVLALTSDGQVVGWGDTTVPDWLTDVATLASGRFHSLALLPSPGFTFASRVLKPGATLTLMPRVFEGQPARLQWYHEGRPLGAAQIGNTLPITAVEAEDLGEYTAVCEFTFGRVTNTVLRLSFGPDLLLTTLETPAAALAGSSVDLSWTLANDGLLPATNGWVDRVYLSTDEVVGDDVLIGEFPVSTPLGVGETLTRIQRLQLPADLPADRDYWWVLVTNANGAVAEDDEANNAAVAGAPMRLWSVAVPDLRVTAVESSPDLRSGQPVLVTWSVANAGLESTRIGVWTDAVYVSVTTNLDETSQLLGRVTRVGPLGTNAVYRGSLTTTLSQGLGGTHYFIVQADAGNQVDEGPGESDNATASKPVVITLTPPPDLQVTALQAPGAALSGGTMTLTWTVANGGPGVTSETVWVDEVYLSLTPALETGAVLLGSFPHDGALLPGSTYHASGSVRIPFTLRGLYYLLVHTDARNQVFEHGAETNNVRATPAPIPLTLTPVGPGLAEGLVVHLPMDGHVLDTSGHTNHGAAFGVTPTVDRFGNEAGAYWFSGVTNFIRVPDSPDLDFRTNDFAFSVWLKYGRQTNTTHDYSIVIDNKHDPGHVNGINLLVDIPEPGAAYIRLGTTYRWTGPLGLNDEEWRHFVFQREQAILTLYIGGQPALTVTNSFIFDLDNRIPLVLGANHTENYRYQNYRGVMDDFRVYRRALTAEEVWRLSTACGRLIAPLGRNGGYVSGPINRVTLAFPRAVSTDSVNATNLIVQGPLGMLAGSDISEVRDRTYEFTLPSLTEEGLYYFKVLSSLRSADGLPLDADCGGASADSESLVAFTLTLDTVPPRVTQHAPAGDVAGTLSSVDVWFSEAMDKATLAPSVVVISNQLGQASSVSGVQEVGLNRWRFTFAPQTATGLYTLNVQTNLSDLAGNPLSTLNSPLLTFNLVPVDLQLSNVTVNTNQLWAGDAVTVSWSGRNASGARLMGDWLDAVYLSRDDRWDIDDRRLATVLHTGGLEEDQPYPAAATVVVPGEAPGDYYLLIRADLANQEKEEGDEANNVTALGPLPVAFRALAPGGLALSGVLTPSSPAHYYAVPLDAGESLRLTLDGTGGSGLSELYLGFGFPPTSLRYDRAAIGGGQDQQLIVTGPPGGGTVFVLVNGERLDGENPYTLQAETGGLLLTSVSPRTSGNAAPATVTLSGAGFDESTTVQLAGAGGIVRVPSAVRFVSASALSLELALPNWSPGAYDLIATKGEAQAQLAAAFEVLGGGEPAFEANLTAPNNARPGFPVWQTLTVDYANRGNAALPAPMLVVKGDHGALLTLDPEAALAARSLRTPPDGVADTVEFLAVGSSETPGILRPGESGRATIYFLGTRETGGFDAVTFSLRQITASNTLALNWNEQEDYLRPAELTEARWVLLFRELRNWLGPTWGTYVAALDGVANVVKLPSERGIEVKEFLGLMVNAALEHLGGTISGRVSGGSSGEAIPDAVVTVWDIQGVLVALAGSEPDGSFLVTGLSDGSYSFEVHGYSVEEPNLFSLRANESVTDWILRVEPLPGGDGVIHVPTGADRGTALMGPPPAVEVCSQVLRTCVDFRAFFKYLEGMRSNYPKSPNHRAQFDDLFDTIKDLEATKNALLDNLIQVAAHQLRSITPFAFDTVSASDALVKKVELVPSPHYQQLQPLAKQAQEEAQSLLEALRSLASAGSDSAAVLAFEEIESNARGISNLTQQVNHYLNQAPDFTGGVAVSFAASALREPAEKVIVAPIYQRGLTPVLSRKTAFENAVSDYERALDPPEVCIPVITGLPTESAVRVDAARVLDFRVDGCPSSGSFHYNISISPANGAAIAYVQERRTGAASGSRYATLVFRATAASTYDVRLSAADSSGRQGFVTLRLLVSADGPAGDNPPKGGGEPVVIGPIGTVPLPRIIIPGPLPIVRPRPLPICACPHRGTVPAGDVRRTVSTVVRRSYDPNEKLGPAGYGEAAFLQSGNVLLYEIYFENLAGATAPAQEVVVEDVLAPSLDLETFELLEIAFGDHLVSIPPGLDHYEDLLAVRANSADILVAVQAALDHATRTLHVSLTALDPLSGWFPEDPLVGLLYPNDVTHRGEGHISYLVSPKPSVTTGTRIDNRARIWFDYNDPIDTPSVCNTIDAGAPASKITSASAGEDDTIALTWTAADDAGGAGLAGVDLLASADGGDCFYWAQDLGPEQTSAVFKGAPGVTYRFISVARDHAGHEQPRPSDPGATIRIPVPPAVIASVAVEPDGRVVIKAVGTVGFSYAVEASEDLVEWKELGLVTATAEGLLEFVDLEALTLSQRFYRLHGP